MSHSLSSHDFSAAIHCLFLLWHELHSSPALPLFSQKDKALVLVSEMLDFYLELTNSSYFRVTFQAVYSGLLLEYC